MAEKEAKDTKIKDGQDQTADKNIEQLDENIGEFGDQQIDEQSREKKPRKEFQVLDLGNEDNVSDWLVNMLSGRLWDFAINNLEWAGDIIDRAISNRMENIAEKRQMALKIKEIKQKGQEAARKPLVNEDGTLNASAAKSRTYDDKGNLIMLDDYEVRKGDKIVDAKGNPLTGKMADIEKQLHEDARKSLLNKDGTLNAAAADSRGYDEKGNLTSLGSYPIQKGDKIVDAEGKPLTGKTMKDIEKQLQESKKRVDEKQSKGQQKEGAENTGKGGNEKRPRKKIKRKAGKEGKDGKKEKSGKSAEKAKEQPKKKGKRTLQAAGKSVRETQAAKESQKRQVRQNKSRKKAVQQEKNNTKSSRNRILDLAHRSQRNNANSNTRNNAINRGRNNQGR